jgi:hypothetical protein
MAHFAAVRARNIQRLLLSVEVIDLSQNELVERVAVAAEAHLRGREASMLRCIA